MFNCFIIDWNGKQFAIFKTEHAADNFVHMMNSNCLPAKPLTIRGAFIENVGF